MKSYYLEHYNTPGPDGLQTGIWTIAAGHYMTINETHYAKDRTTDDYLLGYCVAEGTKTYKVEVGGRAHCVKAGDLFSTPPGVRHSVVSNNAGWEIWWFHYAGPQATNLMNWMGFSISNPIIHVGVKRQYIAHFRRIFELLQHKPSHYELDVSIEIQSLLYAAKKRHRSAKAGNARLIEALTKSNSVGVDEMAAAAGMSKFHFIRKAREVMGITPWRYVIRQRITRAKELLSDRSLTVKEVAHKIGFKRAPYFSAVFHKETGMTTTAFRRSLMRNNR